MPPTPQPPTLMLPRRAALQQLAVFGAVATGALGASSPARAQAAPKKLGAKLRFVVPALARSSLDTAARELGDALVIGGQCDEIEYENREAKGGTPAIAYFADKFGRDPNAFFVADTSLAGSIAIHKPALDLSRLQPLARITIDYLVVVVAANGPIKTPTDLAARFKAGGKQMAVGIGQAGGADHVFAGLLAKAGGANPEEVTYTPFLRGFELVDAVVSGKLAAGVSGYSTFSADVASGKLRALGVSARKSAYGVKALREQGVDVDLANWRAVFTGQGVPPPRQAEMVEALKAATASDPWKKTLKQNYWESAWLAGNDLTSLMEIDSKTIQVAVQLLKLKG